MDDSIGWELYRSFLGVMTEGSLSGAARALGLTQPTLGRHVAALEKALGLALFTRSPTGLQPTGAAQALLPHAQAMASTAAALRRSASSQGEGVRGAVRVTASEVIGVEVLPAIVARLRRQHPDLQLELVLSNQVQDLLRRDADIAVRMTPPTQGALLARQVGCIEVGLHATPAYLAEHGTPRQLAELAGHALIGFDRPSPFVRSVAQRLGGLARQDFALRCDSDLAQLALIRAGAGIGFCQVALAARTPPLHRLLAREVSVPLDTWIVMHEDLRHNRACRATFDALVEGLSLHAQPRVRRRENPH